MSQVKISFQNYKLLKEGEYNLSGGSVFMIQGPNNVGKTSFLNLLKSIMNVKDDTVNPVTFGEKEGYALGTITGADDNDYQFRYDFNIDGKNKFKFIGPDNKVIKTIGEMRAIFNYTHFTVEEFFDWSRTADGKRKQRDIFLKLLSDAEQAKIEDIDSKINTSNGTIIEQRRVVNREVEFLKKKIESNIFTKEDNDLYDNREEVSRLLLSLKDERSDIEMTLASTEEKERQIEALNASYEANSVSLKSDIDDTTKEVERLEEQLRLAQEKLVRLTSRQKTDKEAYDIKKAELEKAVDVDFIKNQRDALEKLKARILLGEETNNRIIAITARKETAKEDTTKYAIEKAKADQYDKEIEKLREEKKSIISNNPNIPIGISLDDDGITFDGVPFLETDMSKSRATRLVAELMIKVNKAPIMLMGDAESLGYEALDYLKQIAEEHNRIIVFAEHVRESDDIHLVCYDDMVRKEKETTNNNKLF